MNHTVLATVFACFVSLAPHPGLLAADKIRVLIIDGQNNHDWIQTTRATRSTLVATGRFIVDVTTAPGPSATTVDWQSWRPRFSDYAAVLNNYSGDPWPEAVKQSFAAYVAGGGGFVGVHAANNPFVDWKEYNEIIGLGWRAADFGRRVMIDDATGAISFEPPGGTPAGHGRRHPFLVTVRAPEHPIMKGFPKRWLHGKDELYHAQRGPNVELNILSTAFSAKESGGSGDHEPTTWTTRYGKGRAVTTVLGHFWREQKDIESLHCVGFQTVLVRSMEWAATGEVTISIPVSFPTADAISLQDPTKLSWELASAPQFRAGSCCDRAHKGGGSCQHPCCVAWLQHGVACPKCNAGLVPAAGILFKAGGCCFTALNKGGSCAHPCCVKATKAGAICKNCNPG